MITAQGLFRHCCRIVVAFLTNFCGEGSEPITTGPLSFSSRPTCPDCDRFTQPVASYFNRVRGTDHFISNTDFFECERLDLAGPRGAEGRPVRAVYGQGGGNDEYGSQVVHDAECRESAQRILYRTHAHRFTANGQLDRTSAAASSKSASVSLVREPDKAPSFAAEYSNCQGVAVQHLAEPRAKRDFQGQGKRDFQHCRDLVLESLPGWENREWYQPVADHCCGPPDRGGDRNERRGSRCQRQGNHRVRTGRTDHSTGFGVGGRRRFHHVCRICDRNQRHGGYLFPQFRPWALS